MKYYLDTEFHEYEKNGTPTIDLISIGIIAEDGSSYYAICNEFDLDAAWQNQWLFDNVLLSIGNEMNDIHYNAGEPNKTAILGKKEEYRKILQEHGKTKEQIAKDILLFAPAELSPEFYAYYADYDWVVFCWLFGRMIDLPKGYPMYCRDLKQMLDEKVSLFSREDFFTAFDFKGEGLSDLTLEEKLYHIKMHVRYPSQQNEHNALADAKWNKELHSFILNLSE